MSKYLATGDTPEGRLRTRLRGGARHDATLRVRQSTETPNTNNTIST